MPDVGASEGECPVPVPVFVPPVVDVPRPPTGPVEYDLDVEVHPGGTGIWKFDLGCVVTFGTLAGFIEGLVVGGAGFAS